MSHDFIKTMQARLMAERGLPIVGGGGATAHRMTVGPGDVHIDTAMSNLAVRYRNREFIADYVSPVIPVEKRSNKYFVFGVDASFTIPNANIAGQMGRPGMVSYGLTTQSYAVSDYGLMDFIPSDVEANADAPLDPVMDSTEIVTDYLHLARELRVANSVFTSGNYGSQTSALSGTARWDSTAADPVKDIQDAIANSIVRPNCMVIGEKAWNYLRNHANLKAFVVNRAATTMGATPLIVTPEVVAAAFELDHVYIGRAKYLTNIDGASNAFSYVWGNSGQGGQHCALIKVEQQASMRRTQNFTYTFRFKPAGGSEFEVRSWFDQALGVRGGTWLKVTHSDTEVIVGGQYVGWLLQTVVS